MRRPGLILLLLAMALSRPLPAAEPECVVLLHGIGLRGWTMAPLAARLRDAGYRTVNVTYPSRTMPFEQLAGEYLPAQLRAAGVDRAPRLHFVTHSMGGIVLRLHLAATRPPNLGRVVMLGPPNQGSAAADRVARQPLLGRLLGPNLPRLGTTDDAVVRQLGPADFEVGIIAGRSRLNPLFAADLPGENDGAVLVAATHLAGLRDFLVLPFSHTVMLWRRETARQVLAFLRDGAFIHPPEPAAP